MFWFNDSLNANSHLHLMCSHFAIMRPKNINKNKLLLASLSKICLKLNETACFYLNALLSLYNNIVADIFLIFHLNVEYA